MARIRVAVIFGGRSSEHGISCVSAGSILRALDPAEFDVVAIGITTDGRPVMESTDPDRLRIVDGVIPSVDPDKPRLVLDPDPTTATLHLVDGDARLATLADVDVVFPVLHGPWGEDGTIQGLLEMAGVPYVGSGVLASSVGMDKAAMKAMFRSAGLAVGPYEVVTDVQWRTDPQRVLERIVGLGMPVFVKPARAGSSMGITKVHDPDALPAAIAFAREHDPKLVVEAGFDGVREVECGVVQDVDGRPRASRCAEIVVHGEHEFYDFEAKYLDDSADLVVPADLPEAVETKVRRLAVEAFEALGCEGLARVDFFVLPDGTAVVNEVNTMPGFTSVSMFPRMWAASGMGYTELVTHLVHDAMRRGTGLR